MSAAGKVTADVRDIIAILAALRLTRFVTTDWLGEWTIVHPAKSWAMRHDGVEGLVAIHDPDNRSDGMSLWRSKLVSGLDCPFCVGFWLTLGTLAASRMPMPKGLAVGRDVLLKALAGSYVVGHASSRIDV